MTMSSIHQIFIYLIAQLLLMTSKVEAECTYVNDQGSAKAKLAVLQPLIGRRYVATDVNNSYSYDIGICTNGPDVSEAPQYKDAGVLQRKNAKDPHPIVIGKYSQTKFIKGREWVMLRYEQGETYGSHCNKENRRAVILISCDEEVPLGEEKVFVVDEYNSATSDCYYLFELATSVMCKPKPLITIGLSVGSILLIVLVCLIIVYIVGGILYNRFVLGAKGMEQFPNHSFWQDFGNLQADGCNFICRTGGRREPRSYKGIGDDQLQEEDERDDHLLPM